MSIANETQHSEAYKRLKFVEFLELLCRVADHVYKANPTNQSPFDEQLGYILDQLLWKVGLHRNCPRIHWQDVDDESDQGTSIDSEDSIRSSEMDSDREQKKKKRKFKHDKQNMIIRQQSTMIHVVDADLDFESINLSDVDDKIDEENEEDDLESPTKLGNLGTEEDYGPEDDEDY